MTSGMGSGLAWDFLLRPSAHSIFSIQLSAFNALARSGGAHKPHVSAELRCGSECTESDERWAIWEGQDGQDGECACCNSSVLLASFAVLETMDGDD